MHLYGVFELRQLIAARQLPPDQQEGCFQEAAVRRQVLHRVAAVGQQPLLTIDVTDGGLGGRHSIQTGSKFNPCPRMAQVP